tara:strand:- start:52 stop:510 length:459 start_codon:yes stop_codon:yes gene_type:complete
MDGEKQDIDFGKYGFGTSRSLRDYEKYAGLNFKLRAVQQHTMNRENPPNPVTWKTDEEWEDTFCTKSSVNINVPLSDVDQPSDCQFWFVGAHDKSDKEIYRKDMEAKEVEKHIKNNNVSINLDFSSSSKPATWTIWPFSRSKQWMEKLTRKI